MLSSSKVDRRKLVDPEIVIAKYPLHHKKIKISTLALKLAEKSYFGDEFLSKCTALGTSRYPALPISFLNDLKQTVFQ